MQNKLILLTSIFWFSTFITATGQKLVNSPYARFNIGTLEPAGSFRSLGMGGTGVSFRDNSSIYFSNPASYSSIDTISFVFDFGLDYSINKLSDGVSDFSSDDMNFDHLMIGFPFTKGWGFAAGLIPYSNGYYKMSESILEGDPDYDPVTGAYSSFHMGEGSFASFFAGTGITFLKNFSAGVNLKILFGQIKRTNQVIFDEYEDVFHFSNTEKLQINGVNFDYGVQYTASFKNNYFINAGFSITPGKYYNCDYLNISYLFNSYSSADTLSYITDADNKAYLPGSVRMGLSAGRKNKLVAGIDYISTKWSEADILGADGYMADTRSFLFGVEFIPDKYSNFNFLKRVEYRAGGHIEDNYLIINNEQIKEFGFTAGLGIPLRRTLSKANLFFDFTRKSGTLENDLHREDYFTLGVSLNLYDFWFMKRKYD
jgi:hypothetical protein